MTRTHRHLFSLLTVAAIALVSGATLYAEDAPKPDKDGYIPLFDGKTLKGWDGNPALWSVEDGCITGKTGKEGEPNHLTYNQFIVYEGDVPENFVLEFDIWLSKDGNSGVQYRSWRDEDKSKPGRVYGYQADFDGAHTYSGIVYGENFRGILAQRGTVAEVGDDHQPKEVKRFAENEDVKKTLKVEDWNHYKITAKGFHFVQEINGVKTSELTDNDKDTRRKDGVIAIQAHVGPPMKVQLKNIKIKKID